MKNEPNDEKSSREEDNLNEKEKNNSRVNLVEEEICIIEINETEKKKSTENSPLLHNFRTMTPEQPLPATENLSTNLIDQMDEITLIEEYELNFIHSDNDSDNYLDVSSNSSKSYVKGNKIEFKKS